MSDLRPEPQPLPDPGRLAPANNRRKWSKYALAGVCAVFVLYFLLGKCTPNVPAPGAKKQLLGARKSVPPAPQVLEKPDANLLAELSACSLQLAERQAKTGVLPPKLSEDNPKLALLECQALLRVPLPPDAQTIATAQEQPAQQQKTVVEQIRDERKRREEASLFTHSAGIPNHQAFQGRAVEEAHPADTREPAEEREPTIKPVVAQRMHLPAVDPATATEMLPESTMIKGILENELNGEYTGPVKVLVSDNVYIEETRTRVIPQGAVFVGQAERVTNLGQQRLAVSFHKLIIGHGSSAYAVKLTSPGLDQQGATALHGKTNNHYFQIFGASLAIGAIGGLAQIGNSYGGYGYDPSAQFRNGMTQSMAQSSEHVLDRFLNRLPTITIPAGTTVQVWLTDDLALPEYSEPTMKLEPAAVAER